MKVNFYPIPARQAIAQGKEPKEQAEVVFWGSDARVVIQFEDGTMENVDVVHLQEVPAKPVTKAPAAKPKAASKKSD